MPHLTQPRIRPHVVKEACPDIPRVGPACSEAPCAYQLVDRLGLAPPLPLTAEESIWLDLLDGTGKLADLAHGNAVTRPANADDVARFTRRLENNLMLEGA